MFGFKFTNGFAVAHESNPPVYFSIEDNTLFQNSITLGRNNFEKVNRITTFTGQAFKIPDDAIPILVFSENFVNKLPDTAWVFHENTVQYDVNGWSQVAYKNHGKGKVVAIGEAAMFSAQLAGPNKVKMGMNNEMAQENYQLLLNVIHWLDGKLE